MLFLAEFLFGIEICFTFRATGFADRCEFRALAGDIRFRRVYACLEPGES